jgi:serine O-acetyltransferase
MSAATVNGVAPDQRVDPQVTIPDWGLFRLILSDYRFLYRYYQESMARSLLLLAPRMLLSPSLQFAVLVRLAQRAPRPLGRIAAYLQVVMFSSEFFGFHDGPGIELGAAVAFPHPFGIIVGPGTKIGSRVVIFHHAMIGTDRRWFPGDELYPPVIGDDVIVGGASRVMGRFSVGEGAVIGLNVFVRRDVPPMSTLLLGGLKPAGEWSDPRVDGRESPPPPELLEISPYAPASARATP